MWATIGVGFGTTVIGVLIGVGITEDRASDGTRQVCAGQNQLRRSIVEEAKEDLDESLNVDPLIAAAFPADVIARGQELARIDFEQTKRRFAPIVCP